MAAREFLTLTGETTQGPAADRLGARLALVGADARGDEDLRARKTLLVLISVLILPVAALAALGARYVRRNITRAER